MYSDGALVSEISGVAVLMVYFFSFLYGGRDPFLSPSSSCGSEPASEDEHSDLPLLFELQPSQMEYLQRFNIKPMPLLLKALYSASGDSLNSLLSSERDFTSVWSIWIPPVLLFLASGSINSKK